MVDNKSIDAEVDDPAHESARPPTPRNQSDSSMQSVPLSAQKETGSGNLT